jgi:hypothetical protein
MGKSIKIVFIFSGTVFLLAILVNYLGKRQFEKLEKIIPPEELSEIQTFSPEQLLELEEKGLKEFVSPEGDFKIKYPSDWIEIKSEFFEKEVLEDYEKKYDLKKILVAQKFTLKGEFAFLIISVGNFQAQKTTEDIIEEMKEANQEQGWEMQVINLEANKNEATFGAEYQKTDRNTLHSQEKIIFLQAQEGIKRGYSVAIITLEKDWHSFGTETEEIINSIEINL